MRVCLPGSSREPYSSLASERYKMSLISVDFPEPETPVITVITPRGNLAVTSCRLCDRAPSTVMYLPVSGRGASRCITVDSPDR